MVLRDLAFNDGELSVLLTSDSHIAELNMQYLGREGPTNVLAFPMSYLSECSSQAGGSPRDIKSKMMGDIVISVDRASWESKNLGEPLEETIYRLLIHGLLHLLNYDHERSPQDAIRMEKEERRLQKLITDI
ncbi:MAG: rRNA maturation RNase YbeY [Thermodesulfobacteriota bacterium]|nr:rRNA maturation RNase YbeY [Thermodesulfobacteriota bacterium]